MKGPGLLSSTVAIGVLAFASACSNPSGTKAPAAPAQPGGKDRPAVILMIGDGMGRGQIEAASYFRTDKPDGLFIQTLPRSGEMVTSSLTGITDSAAAGTAMACGVPTFNEWLGLDARGQVVQNLVELAHAHGWTAGVVTTASVTDATPAAFTSHVISRDEQLQVADLQSMETQPEVMLGGGSRYFLPEGRRSDRTDGGMLTTLEDDGYKVVTTASELEAARAAGAGRIAGFFARDSMTYVARREASSEEPTLTEMSLAAIDTLRRGGKSFFLMIEGGLIDKAAHHNDLEDVVQETLAFDEAVKAVGAWASQRPAVTLMVTADHETGGLEVVSHGPVGKLPEVTWTRKTHTNARVPIFAQGPDSEVFAGKILGNRWIHAVASARIEGRGVEAPEKALIPDGDLRDLRYTAALQQIEEMPGKLRVDSLRVDADSRGLALGVEGLFPRHNGAIVILVDADYGSGTGLAVLPGDLHDRTGVVDTLLSSLKLDGSGLPGFGADYALVEVDGTNAKVGVSKDRAGLRALAPPQGSSSELGWLGAAINFADPITARDAAANPPPPTGMEAFIPWDRLYPDLGGHLPAGATLALAAFYVSPDGSKIYNQALPHYPAGVDPARTGVVQVPGLVVFRPDKDGDGVADGDRPPEVVWAGGAEGL